MMSLKALLLFLSLILFLLPSSCTSTKTITGSVTDYDTKQPVTDAIVTVGRIGWGMSNGHLVWDKGYSEKTTTDEAGKFSVTVKLGDSVRILVTKEDYVNYFGWHSTNKPVSLQIKSEETDNTPLVAHMLEIGMKEFQPYGWVFSEQRITFEPNEADIFPIFPEDFFANYLDNYLPITLQARGNGGVQSILAQEMGITSDFLVYPDVAPDEGYSPAYNLKFRPRSTANTQILFIRTQDGQHYAKCEFDPSSYTTVGSADDANRGTRGIWLKCVYNPEASRSLPYRK